MDNNKIGKIMKSAAEAISNNQLFLLTSIKKKAEYLYSKCPGDMTARMISNVLDEYTKPSITRAELRGLYETYYSPDTKFASYFAEELDFVKEEPKKVKVASSTPMKSAADYVDPKLAHLLNKMMGKVTTVSDYTKDVGVAAIKKASIMLSGVGAEPKVTIGAGNEHYIVTTASYATPKGTVEIHIPLHSTKSGIADAGIFFANGVHKLTTASVREYVKANAGNQTSTTAVQVLNGLMEKAVELGATQVTSSEVQEASKAFSSFSIQDALAQKVASASVVERKAVSRPSSPQDYAIAKKFASPEGLASLAFSPQTIEAAKGAVESSVKKAGHYPRKVEMMSFKDDSFTFGVTVDAGASFIVPILIKDNKVSRASIMVVNKSPMPLNKTSIDSILARKESDTIIAQAFSPFSKMGENELLTVVAKALQANDVSKAKEVLHIIDKSGFRQAYKQAFRMYSDYLTGKKTAAVEASASPVDSHSLRIYNAIKGIK